MRWTTNEVRPCHPSGPVLHAPCPPGHRLMAQNPHPRGGGGVRAGYRLKGDGVALPPARTLPQAHSPTPTLSANRVSNRR